MDLDNKIKSIHNLLHNKKFNQAKQELEKLIKKFPKNSYLLNLIGLTYQYLNDYNSSINFFISALKNDEKNIAAMNNLANSYKKQLNFFEAEKIYKKVINIDPDYVHALNNFANLKIEINDYESAISLLERAILISNKRNIKSSEIMITLAKVYQSINNLEKVKEILNKIFTIDPNFAQAHKLLSEITKYSTNDKKSLFHVDQMKKIIDEINLKDQDKIFMAFALGKSQEDLKNFKEAYYYLKLANDLRKGLTKSNLKDEILIFNDLIRKFDKIEIKSVISNFSSKKIIFVCGMPRSGTTLVEQILSSHPKVYGAGELLNLERIIQKNFLEDNKINKQKIIELQSAGSEKIIQEYLNYFKVYNFNESVILDKTPQNFKWIGFIKIFFPNSKIIVCQRNPKDNCLSLFKNNFPSSMMSWAFDQEEIAEYYNQYYSLVNFWKIKTPNEIYELNYEKLIDNNKEEISSLLKFCDLNLDSKCFNFTKFSKTPIKTVSVSQASKPIYKDSVNSSNSYENSLQKMFKKINII